jgi:hypothetical protein
MDREPDPVTLDQNTNDSKRDLPQENEGRNDQTTPKGS